MGVTSPSGISFPDLLSQYNYTAHMAAQAQSVQAALDRQGNAYSGTGVERVAFTSSAKQGAIWSDSDGKKMMYQFRDDRWHPEYEFVELSLTGSNRIFLPDVASKSGLHIHSYGRFATLSGTWVASQTFTWTPGTWRILGFVPSQYRPPGTKSVKAVTWGWQPKNTPLRQVFMRTEVIASSGSVQVNNEELFTDTESPYDANISIAGLTWPIAT